MEKEYIKSDLLKLIEQLYTEGQTKLEEKALLSSITEVCNHRIAEITKNEDGVPWYVLVQNGFSDDIYNYLKSYIKEHNIPLYGAKLCIMRVSSGAFRMYLDTRFRQKQNLHNLQSVLEDETKAKKCLAYIGADVSLRSLSEVEYNRFIEMKESDESYPQCFLKETIKTLHLLEPQEQQ